MESAVVNVWMSLSAASMRVLLLVALLRMVRRLSSADIAVAAVATSDRRHVANVRGRVFLGCNMLILMQ